ncbi:MAG: TrkH family potassium uptake protein, partial [Sporomusa sp.]
MRTQIVAGFLGKMLCAFALVMLVPLLCAIVQQEEVYRAFALSALITGLFGIGLFRYGETTGHIGMREGFLIVAGTWLLTGMFGALPYWFSGLMPSLLCAVFESVSGLTTTGASVITNVEMLPASLLLWRSLTHWLGGMGIIVLFLVFLTNLGADAINLFKAEAPGPTVDRVMPRIRHMAKILWLMYVGFTFVEIILLYLAGMDLFDAVNHAFATMATGGFSTKNASIKYYDSLPIEIVLNFFMFLAGGNFGLYYLVWKKGWGRLLKDAEFKLYLTIVTSATV